MARYTDELRIASRRNFLKTMRWTPLLFLSAPLHTSPFPARWPIPTSKQTSAFAFSDFHLIPHYPAKSPLENILRRVAPGADEYITEKYAWEIKQLLDEWGRGLKASPPALSLMGKFLSSSLEGISLSSVQETNLRSENGIHVSRRHFAGQHVSGRERFLHEMQTYLSAFSVVETAEFEIVGINEAASSSSVIQVDIRYSFVGSRKDSKREQRIGQWRTQWERGVEGWKVQRWEAAEETLSRTRSRIFIDVTSQALGQNESYRDQMLHGVDYWRTMQDAACGIDVYGNSGVAVGDASNSGMDDIYVCQPAGLPNRLYRNRGDGTFEDVTEQSGVGVLDNTACALFADFENKGLQDLLVVCATGPLLFLNQGNGKFSIKRDAFKFASPPQGTFTHAAIADYDRDGHLDIYFCLYSYYLGLDQYHYPAPYFDARNGPPNFLLHNEGNATFQDRTEAAGLNVDNDRYSFACAWGDHNSNGWPDLYVANDFGRNNLYRNNGDGTFTTISTEAGVEDVGAGMSACWFDFDNDGNQDIYVADMWSAAGIRVSEQAHFHEQDPENIRGLYRQHARGNSLYRNQGDGKFANVSTVAGVEMGRWAWSSDTWDFDHDGFPDLYIANGYISGPDQNDLASFFWRQLVAKSPANASPSINYEQGWNAINELVRSDGSWSANERNVFYLNNHDGTFSDISGITGLDFTEDSRSFALADLNHDGRLEVVLKNRNAPQLRVLRNAMQDIGGSIAFRLRGQKSNRDAIGAAVTIEVRGKRQTKYLQAGSGFLSQHTKELFFGVGKTQEIVRASIRWPSGLVQTLDNLPVNQRIEIEEGSAKFAAKPFALSPQSYSRIGEPPKPAQFPSPIETWLIEPLSAPEFSLTDLQGNSQDLRSFRSRFLLLNFWTIASSICCDQLKRFKQYQSASYAKGFRIVCINVDEPLDAGAVQSLVAQEGLPFPILIATANVAGIYNIVYRYLFDRRMDLTLPSSFLIDEEGMIVKVYQGAVNPQQVAADIKAAPQARSERIQKALPFPGTLYADIFHRNDFTYGVAFFQRGYLDQAAASFQQVIAAKPQEPEAYYNLGTLHLRRNNFAEARQYLEQAVKLRPDYPEAWNNLGMVAAHEGKGDEAVRNFKQSLLLKPGYTTALLNLGNLYRRQGNIEEAKKLLNHALEVTPDDPEASYSLGMFYAQSEQLQVASDYLEKAVSLRPDYPEALNNLGILFVRQQRYPEAEDKFKTCIQVAPNFDQAYLNLARLYVILKDDNKARAALQSLLRQQPDNKIAQQALELLH